MIVCNFVSFLKKRCYFFFYVSLTSVFAIQWFCQITIYAIHRILYNSLSNDILRWYKKLIEIKPIKSIWTMYFIINFYLIILYKHRMNFYYLFICFVLFQHLSIHVEYFLSGLNCLSIFTYMYFFHFYIETTYYIP